MSSENTPRILSWASPQANCSSLEVKGEDTEQDQVKRRFLDNWVKAVNDHGGFGTWAWEVSKNPGDIKDLARHAQPSRASPTAP